MLLTIFTPTYNRAYTIGALYESLCVQTNQDFEWLVVDDGSTDDTEKLFKNWVETAPFPVRYYKQANGGKHRAINKGLSEAKGELFFVVDSDDKLPKDSVSTILLYYAGIKNNASFSGVTGLCCYFSGKKVGGEENWKMIDTDPVSIRIVYGVKGDLADVLKTDIARRYPFPEFENEKFCPEALVYNRLSKDYQQRYFYENIYSCEYLPDGLTAKIVQIRRNSPMASMTYYSEYSRLNVPLRYKLKGNINYWRFSRTKHLIQDISRFQMCNMLSLIGIPVGFLMKLKDSLK